MKISDNGLALICAFEGCHSPVKGRPGFFKAYVDPVGVLTIGWGSTNHGGHGITKDTVWSQAQCDAALRKDLGKFERHVEKLAKVPLAQHEFDALVSWSYNTGGPATATLWKKLNAGNKAAVPAELAKWNKGGGKVLAGLVRRRKAEGLLFAGNPAAALKTVGAKMPAVVKQEPAAPAQPPDTPLIDDGYDPVAGPPAQGWLASLIAAIAAIFRRKG